MTLIMVEDALAILLDRNTKWVDTVRKVWSLEAGVMMREGEGAVDLLRIIVLRNLLARRDEIRFPVTFLDPPDPLLHPTRDP